VFQIYNIYKGIIIEIYCPRPLVQFLDRWNKVFHIFYTRMPTTKQAIKQMYMSFA
jgi:hypothetical protein